jgi:ribosomal protein L37AE/L43A
MYGNTIQERRCPACGNRRTVRVGRSSMSFCFNCRTQWSGGASAQPTRSVDGSLTAAEHARLEAYRGAVRAGLYRDW